MRDLRRLKRLTNLKTRLRDAVRANLAEADQLLTRSQELEAEAEQVYEQAVQESVAKGELAAHVLYGRAERAKRGAQDVRQAQVVVQERTAAREQVQDALREAHREVKAMELLTSREKLARRLKKARDEQALTEEVTARRKAEGT